jgi:hypothetical protein
MYYHFGNNGMLQNGLLLKLVRAIIGPSKEVSSVVDDHASFSGVTLHENGKFLYQSRQADWAVAWGYADWGVLFAFGAWASGSHIALLPMLVSFAFVPRRWTQQTYFCWHAEMLPHTEQVIFQKSFVFGGTSKHIVDIKDLEKVDADVIENKLMWVGNMFDDSLVFRDSHSGEVFVFDKQGIWNEDTLNHPLLN